MMMKRNVRLGDTHFVGPFSADGFWVSDARGTSVLEARDRKVAKALAEILNTQVISKERELEASWKGSVDRMGGSFDDDEIIHELSERW